MTYPYDPYAGSSSAFGESSFPGADYGAPVPTGGEPVLVAIGPIQCTQTHVITPAGTAPIAGARWTFVNQTYNTRAIPQWALITAIVTALLFCGLGLLFLLVKEDRTQGYVQITVEAEGLRYSTSIPVYSPLTVSDLGQRVNYAQSVG